MSGLNKNKNKKYGWRQLSTVIGIIYVLSVLVLVALIYNIPAVYEQINRSNVESIVDEVHTAMTASTSDAMRTDLAQITSEHTMDIVVIDAQETIYATKPSDDFEQLRAMTNSDTVSYQSAFAVSNNGTEYQVWMAIYKTTPEFFFVFMLSLIGVSVIILCGLMAMLIFLMFRKLVGPIRRLRDNILRLREYRLADVQSQKVSSEYDALSRELSDFTDDLQGKIDSINTQYSLLERDLEAQREKSVVKTRLASSLIHDLKTPLNITLLQTEALKGVLAENSQAIQALEELSVSAERMRGDVNQILEVIHTENLDEHLKHESIEIIKAIHDTLLLFKPLFKERNIAYYMDAPQNLYMTINEIELKQIIHNMISNACQYADENGVFELIVYQEHNTVIIEAYNDKVDQSSIDFERVFDLFYHVDTEQVHYGSGIGLYTVKSMVEQYHGTTSFAPRDNGVVLTITLPIDGGDLDA